MKNKGLELRMYGLVAYQLGGTIHAGIQFQHATQRYTNKCIDCEFDEDTISAWNSWRKKWETSIVLSGGSTNNNKESIWYGDMNIFADALDSLEYPNAKFYEPDLGDQLSCVCFIVDERVFDTKKYPDYNVWLADNYPDLIDIKIQGSSINVTVDEDITQKYIEFLGGNKNVVLRGLLKGKKLA